MYGADWIFFFAPKPQRDGREMLSAGSARRFRSLNPLTLHKMLPPNRCLRRGCNNLCSVGWDQTGGCPNRPSWNWTRLLNGKSAEASQWEEDWNKIAESNERLESALRESKSQLDDLSLDLAVAEERLREQDREVIVLRRRLVEHGKPDLTYVVPDSEVWSPPDEIMSLLDRISSGGDTHLAFSRVVFTGDVDTALEVQARDQASRYAHALWDYIHVLHDYAEASAEGRIAGGVHLYLKSDNISGHKCHPYRHAPGESDTTLNGWGKERIRPVPVEVDPSGEVLMAAHFKPTWRDTFAPRMHYYDDTNNTGKVYIGYIGRHLTTKDT
jgi:hypothetical protein